MCQNLFTFWQEKQPSDKRVYPSRKGMDTEGLHIWEIAANFKKWRRNYKVHSASSWKYHICISLRQNDLRS